jgi:hypothetical protein
VREASVIGNPPLCQRQRWGNADFCLSQYLDLKKTILLVPARLAVIAYIDIKSGHIATRAQSLAFGGKFGLFIVFETLLFDLHLQYPASPLCLYVLFVFH